MKIYNYIYKITNIVNGKTYIGKHSTNKINDGYMGSGNLIKKAIKKYGVENFTKEYLAFCDTEEKLNWLEKFYIKKYHSRIENGNYNLTNGGDGVTGLRIIFTEEHKRKISESKIGSHPSEDARENMRKARYKWLENPDNRKKCSRPGELNGMYGVHRYGKDSPGYGKHRKHTLEEKRKVGRAIIRISDRKIYYTQTELAEELKITVSAIVYQMKHNNKIIKNEQYEYV